MNFKFLSDLCDLHPEPPSEFATVSALQQQHAENKYFLAVQSGYTAGSKYCAGQP